MEVHGLFPSLCVVWANLGLRVGQLISNTTITENKNVACTVVLLKSSVYPLLGVEIQLYIAIKLHVVLCPDPTLS